MLCNASLEALPGSAKYFLIYLAFLTYLFHLWKKLSWEELVSDLKYNHPTKSISILNSLEETHKDQAIATPSPLVQEQHKVSKIPVLFFVLLVGRSVGAGENMSVAWPD